MRLPSICLSAWLVASVTCAQLIDFETLPNSDDLPADNTSLSSPYPLATGSVRFYFLDSNGAEVAPIFEARDDEDGNPQGFASSRHGGSDHGGANYGPILGRRFLRQPDGIGVLPGSFVVDYDVSQPIDALSGEIWDIDAGDLGYEKWHVEILDKTGGLVDEMDSPTGINGGDAASLDSRPWAFSFANLATSSTMVDKIKISFAGTKADGIGLSFNNFDASSGILGGDYNDNGVVDAADYPVFRNQLGLNQVLKNQNPKANTPGTVDAEDYTFWKSKFGNARTASSAAVDTSSSVPEPSTSLLAIMALLAFPIRQCKYFPRTTAKRCSKS